MMAQCGRKCRDCANICHLTATFIAHGSKHDQHVLRGCIKICQKCYYECYQHEDDHRKECAAAGQACLEACRA